MLCFCTSKGSKISVQCRIGFINMTLIVVLWKAALSFGTLCGYTKNIYITYTESNTEVYNAFYYCYTCTYKCTVSAVQLHTFEPRLNKLRCLISLNVSSSFFTLPHQRSSSPGETKLLASEIYEILQSAGKEEAEQAEAAAASCRRKAQFFLGSNNKRAKTVVLHIDGLDDSVSEHTVCRNQGTTCTKIPFW